MALSVAFVAETVPKARTGSAMAVDCSLLALLPMRLGVLGYIAPLAAITASYALFQAANNTAVMATARPEQRGVTSGLLNLSRNLELISGASVMGAVFTLGSAAGDTMAARPEAVAAGRRLTFAVAVALVVVALAIASGSQALSRRGVLPNGELTEGRGLP